MKKITLEESQKIFSQVGLTILENEAKGIDYKYKCIDKEGYLYNRSTHSIQASLRKRTTGFSHVFSTKNPYFYENMLHYIEKEVHTGTILLTPKEEIKNIDQHLVFRCGLCGKEYKSFWHTFMHNTDKICNFCFNRKRSNGEVNTKHKDTNKFHLQAKKMNIVILSGPNVRYHDKVLVQDKDGYKSIVMASSILRGSPFDKFAIKNPFAIDNLRVFAFNHGWDCVVYDQEYKGDKHPLKMMCSCGNDFTVDCNHFIAGKYQCNECRVKQSAIAFAVENWLKENGYVYEKEKRFADCVNKKTLPFDFFLPDYNTCIEVDGIGHYRPIPFGGNKEEAEQIFQDRKINDKIKTEYCKQNKINLIRVPFWEIEGEAKFKKWLKSEILSVKSNDLDK